ncbi:hypothetical protein HAX54_022337 [Datura stramonium]|uniref:Uncharacterized protein n=1 Tax=Datura stramonium TaxID=4076 RepID=A0ABS8UW75_DATST|nr:hypothetical protein [Datura stramonium]
MPSLFLHGFDLGFVAPFPSCSRSRILFLAVGQGCRAAQGITQQRPRAAPLLVPECLCLAPLIALECLSAALLVTQEPDVVGGPTIIVADRHVRDERYMAFIYGKMDLKHRIRVCLATHEERAGLSEQYPINTHALYICNIGITFEK